MVDAADVSLEGKWIDPVGVVESDVHSGDKPL